MLCSCMPLLGMLLQLKLFVVGFRLTSGDNAVSHTLPSLVDLLESEFLPLVKTFKYSKCHIREARC